MSNLRLVETQTDSRIPILEPKNAAEAFKFARRAIVGGLALGAATLMLGHEIRKGIDAVIFPQSIAAELAQPFSIDRQAADAGKFAAGSVVELKLPDSYASDAAANLTNGSYYNGPEVPVEQDIEAEVGDAPGAGTEVYLPAKDVTNLPAGSQVIR